MTLQSQTPQNPFAPYYQATSAWSYTGATMGYQDQYAHQDAYAHQRVIAALRLSRAKIKMQRAELSDVKEKLHEATLTIEENEKRIKIAVAAYDDLVKKVKAHCADGIKRRRMAELDVNKAQRGLATHTRKRPITEVDTPEAQFLEHGRSSDLAIRKQTTTTLSPPLHEPIRSDAIYTAPETSKGPRLDASDAQLAVANDKNEEYFATQKRPTTEVDTAAEAQFLEHGRSSDLAIRKQTTANDKNGEYLATQKRPITEVDTPEAQFLEHGRSSDHAIRKQTTLPIVDTVPQNIRHNMLRTALKTSTSPYMNLPDIYSALAIGKGQEFLSWKRALRYCLQSRTDIFVKVGGAGPIRGGLWSLTETARGNDDEQSHLDAIDWSEGLG